MNSQLIHELTVLALAVFVGFEVISKVPTMLHTPLMSGTNAIHGIVIVGAILVAGVGGSGFSTILGLIAVVFGAINVVGGFVVTDRMLQMFRRKDEHLSRSEAIQLIDLLAIIAFVVGLKRLSHPATARSGNTIAAAGMLAAVAARCGDEGVVTYWRDRGRDRDRLRDRPDLRAAP